MFNTHVLIVGTRTDKFTETVEILMLDKDWDVAFLSDPDLPPSQALGLLTRVDINSCSFQELIKKHKVRLISPPVVVPVQEPEIETVQAPSIKPILVFLSVVVLAILAAWAVWRIST